MFCTDLEFLSTSKKAFSFQALFLSYSFNSLMLKDAQSLHFDELRVGPVQSLIKKWLGKRRPYIREG